MSKSGAQPTLASIEVLISKNKFKAAFVVIAAYSNSADAQRLWKIVYQTFNLHCWLAFLRNPHLNSCLNIDNLRAIMWATKLKLKESDTIDPARFEIHEVMPTIAQNQTWCGMLGYGYFLNYVQYDYMLAEYIVNHIEFVIHFSEVQVAKLVEKAPMYISEVLTLLQSVLQNDMEHVNWALKALKLIFVNIKGTADLMCWGPSFRAISSALLLEFETDADFALEVLKNKKLCTFWVNKGFPNAYKHPLFNAYHFMMLEEHHLKTHPKISAQYHYFVEESLVQITNQLKITDAELDEILLEPVPETYLPSVEVSLQQHFDPSLESLQAPLLKMKEKKDKFKGHK